MITRTSRGTKRFMATAAAVAMIGSTLAISSAASAGPNVAAPASIRLSGADRYATAAAVAGNNGGQNITIVNGESFPDGLASSIFNTAILLTQADSIPAATAEWLENNCGQNQGAGVTGIRVIGGEAAVSSAVFEALGECAPVTRIAGTNRYSTAIAVAEDAVAAPTKIILATGENFPDALTAGPLAIAKNAPIILNNGDSLRADVAAYLDANPTITGVYVVGGETVISAEIEAELAGPRGMNVTRLAGATRADTAVAVAEELDIFRGGPGDIVLVNGSGFADALTASILADQIGARGARILLVDADSIPAATAAWHTTNCETIDQVVAVGGTSVVSASVLAGAVAAATCAPVGITSAALTVSDVKQRTITLDDLSATNTPAVADEVTLTAVEVGALANKWTVSFADGAIAGAVVTDTPNTTPPVHTIVYTDTFSTKLLTQAQFISNFNNSAAGAYFQASLNAGGVGTVKFGDTARVNTTTSTAGSSDYTVVVTFNQAVDDSNGGPPGPPRLSSNQNPAINAYVDTVGASVVAPTQYPAGGSASVTYLFDDEPAVLSLSTGSIKFVAGAVHGAVTNVANASTLVGAF